MWNKIIKFTKSLSLTKVNLALINALLIIIVTMSKDLDEFVRVFGQISLSICMILNAVSGLHSDNQDSTDIGDIDV